MLPTQSDWRDLIRTFLTAHKSLAGSGTWQIEQNEKVLRWSRPVAVEGEISGFSLIARAYPNVNSVTFRLILSHERAIWRLDFSDNETHVNSLNKPADAPGGIIRGPHYHAWPDNERFASANSLPKKLHNARMLPSNIRTFENAFRWFCAQVSIGIFTSDIPEFPKRTTLL